VPECRTLRTEKYGLVTTSGPRRWSNSWGTSITAHWRGPEGKCRQAPSIWVVMSGATARCARLFGQWQSAIRGPLWAGCRPSHCPRAVVGSPMRNGGCQRRPAPGRRSAVVRVDSTATNMIDPTDDGQGAGVSQRLLATAGTRYGKTLVGPANPLDSRGSPRVGHRLSTEAATADVDSLQIHPGRLRHRP